MVQEMTGSQKGSMTNFKYYRKIVNRYTLKQVAESVGISRSAVVSYDNNYKSLKKVSYDVLEKIAKLFDCEIVDLFEDDMKQ